MEEYVKNLAAAEGWTDATTVIVLAGALQKLVDMGCADAEDIEAIIRERGNVQESFHGGPEIGARVEMEGHETVIEITEVPEDQPMLSDGIWLIIDQYGETHRIEREDDDSPWTVLI